VRRSTTSRRVPNAWVGQLSEPAGHLSWYLCAMKSLVIAASWWAACERLTDAWISRGGGPKEVIVQKNSKGHIGT
jgi:hypothetical protein